jgi:hypothetical protein
VTRSNEAPRQFLFTIAQYMEVLDSIRDTNVEDLSQEAATRIAQQVIMYERSLGVMADSLFKEYKREEGEFA